VSLLVKAILSAAALAQTPVPGSIVRLNPALDDIVSSDAKLEQLADVPGRFTREGPTWVRGGGYLIYTARNGNRQAGSPPPTSSDLIKWDPRDGGVSVLVPGFKSDGNTLDRQGRLVGAINIGEGKIVRVEKDGKQTILVSRYDGKPINPNDLVYKSDGVLYFSSPPRYKSASDVPSLFMLKNGSLKRLSPTPAAKVEHPGGLAFSPDEKSVYVIDNPKIMKFAVARDDTMIDGRIFFDMSDQKPLTNSPDGIKVDTKGNVYVTGPGGIWIISAEGRHLGTILAPNRPANLAFGGLDGKSLFITSRPGLYRIALKVSGPLP
jgi:gluconolactonase